MAERATITKPLSDGKALRIIMVGHRDVLVQMG